MKFIRSFLIMVGILGFAVSGFGLYTWDTPRGKITSFPKGHVATTEYTPELITSYPKGHVARTDYRPELIVNYDKQHIPWSESKIKP